MHWQQRDQKRKTHTHTQLRLTASLLLHWNQKLSNSTFGAWSPQVIYLPTVGKCYPVLLEVFIYTSLGLGNYADSGAGAEKLQFQQTSHWWKMEPFLAKEMSQACLPKAGLSLGRDKEGSFERKFQKTISSLCKGTLMWLDTCVCGLHSMQIN